MAAISVNHTISLSSLSSGSSITWSVTSCDGRVKRRFFSILFEGMVPAMLTEISDSAWQDEVFSPIDALLDTKCTSYFSLSTLWEIINLMRTTTATKQDNDTRLWENKDSSEKIVWPRILVQTQAECRKCIVCSLAQTCVSDLRQSTTNSRYSLSHYAVSVFILFSGIDSKAMDFETSQTDLKTRINLDRPLFHCQSSLLLMLDFRSGHFIVCGQLIVIGSCYSRFGLLWLLQM